MKSRSKKLATHSISSALAAIEIYNKPDFPDREQVFSILMVTAWEALLKARVLQLSKNRMESLYIKENSKRYKRNRNKVPFTIDIYEAMRRLSLDPLVSSNIGHLVEIRDAAIHLTAESPTLPYLAFTLGTASLRNYAKLISDWFKMSLADYHFYIMPLAFSTPFRTLKVADIKREPDDIAQLIDSIAKSQQSLPDSKEYYFLCEIETTLVSAKKIASTADLTASIETSNPDAVIVQRAINPLDQYPYSAKQVASQVKLRVLSATSNDVWKAIKALKIKGDRQYSKYSYPTKAAESAGPSKSTGVIYNHDAVLAIIAYLDKNTKKTG